MLPLMYFSSLFYLLGSTVQPWKDVLKMGILTFSLILGHSYSLHQDLIDFQ